MKAIGLVHPTRELIGFPRGTMANDIMRATGTETMDTSNTITTGIGAMTEITTVMDDMVITTGTATGRESTLWGRFGNIGRSQNRSPNISFARSRRLHTHLFALFDHSSCTA